MFTDPIPVSLSAMEVVFYIYMALGAIVAIVMQVRPFFNLSCDLLFDHSPFTPTEHAPSNSATSSPLFPGRMPRDLSSYVDWNDRRSAGNRSGALLTHEGANDGRFWIHLSGPRVLHGFSGMLVWS